MYGKNLKECRIELTELSKNSRLTEPALIAKTRDIENAWLKLHKLRKTVDGHMERGKKLSGNRVIENARQLEELLFSFRDLYRYDDALEMDMLLNA